MTSIVRWKQLKQWISNVEKIPDLFSTSIFWWCETKHKDSFKLVHKLKSWKSIPSMKTLMGAVKERNWEKNVWNSFSFSLIRSCLKITTNCWYRHCNWPSNMCTQGPRKALSVIHTSRMQPVWLCFALLWSLNTSNVLVLINQQEIGSVSSLQRNSHTY